MSSPNESWSVGLGLLLLIPTVADTIRYFSYERHLLGSVFSIPSPQLLHNYNNTFVTRQDLGEVISTKAFNPGLIIIR